MNKKLFFSSKNQNWKTPKKLFEELNREFNFNFDPCPENPKFNGLEIEWKKRNFINPPFKDIKKWLKKGFLESKKGKLCVFLVPSRTDTKWFQELALPFAKEIRFLKGRLRFNDFKNPAPFPSCVIVF